MYIYKKAHEKANEQKIEVQNADKQEQGLQCADKKRSTIGKTVWGIIEKIGHLDKKN